MTLELYLAFVLATAVLIILPGPIVSLVIANSISHGSRAGLCNVAGSLVAMAILLLVVALGLGSLMAIMASAFEWLRWLGVAYLIWLGIQKWRMAIVPPAERPARDAQPAKLFFQGFLISLTNPKTLVFLAAFFPQFMSADAPAAPQLALLCPTFLVIAAILDSSYAVLAGRARHWLRDLRRLKIAERVTGLFMIAAGAWLALARR